MSMPTHVSTSSIPTLQEVSELATKKEWSQHCTTCSKKLTARSKELEEIEALEGAIRAKC